jgi:hypothetical protein
MVLSIVESDVEADVEVDVRKPCTREAAVTSGGSDRLQAASTIERSEYHA